MFIRKSTLNTTLVVKFITMVLVQSKISSQYIFSITELTFSVHGAVLHECQRERETFECFPPLYSPLFVPPLYFLSPGNHLFDWGRGSVCVHLYVCVYACVLVCICVCVCVWGRENESRGKRLEVKERKMKDRQ
jgi:hypothetical protein